ncbi:MAG: hypothetical protein RR359_00945 [Bacilli bacterium]
MNKRLISAFVGIFLIIAGVIGLSLAIYNYVGGGTTENVITSGTLKMTLTEGEGISILNAIPVSDSSGLSNTPYTFKLKNTGTLPVKFTVSLVDDMDTINADGCSAKLLDKSNIKMSLKKDLVFNGPVLLNTLINNVLDEGILNPNAEINYELRLWIDENIMLQSITTKHYHSKLIINNKQTNQ